jgi:hypothetical protein
MLKLLPLRSCKGLEAIPGARLTSFSDIPWAPALQEILHKYVHSNLRSEIIWTKAKLAVVSHLAKTLRTKLRAEQEARARAGSLMSESIEK